MDYRPPLGGRGVNARVFRLTYFITTLAGKQQFLYIEPEMRHIAILHDVFLAFEPYQPFVLGAVKATTSHEVVVGDDFCPDEAPFDVGMYLACRLLRLGAASDGPGPYFRRAGREKRNQVE